MGDGLSDYVPGDLIEQRGHVSVSRALCKSECTEVLWYQFAVPRDPLPILHERNIDIPTLIDVNHTNILRLRKAWYDARSCFHYITEYPPPQTLRGYIAEVVRNPSPAVVTRWCFQVLSALEELHSQTPPILHRNLSCANIFIDASEGIIKIGLPGVEMVIDGHPNPFAGPRSLGAWSPDPRSDIWLFGLAVIEMCTGAVPYGGLSEKDLRLKIENKEMPKEFGEVSDPLIADLIVTCLSFNNLQPTAAQLRENPLFAEFEASRRTTELPGDTSEEALPLSADPRQHPEFIALLARQVAEREQLVQRHEEERKAYCENGAPKSFRALLKA
jgi:WNK lysine deficient protein kinase